MKPSTIVNETDLDELESQLPAAADSVFSDAYEQAIRMGLSVVVAIDAQVIEVFPDGSKKHIKTIKPATPAVPGQTWSLP
jgi:hypothetical protein